MHGVGNLPQGVEANNRLFTGASALPRAALARLKTLQERSDELSGRLSGEIAKIMNVIRTFKDKIQSGKTLRCMQKSDLLV